MNIPSDPCPEIALLGFLLTESLHGYEIHRRLTQPGGPGAVWYVKRSNVYAMLDRMESADWLTSQAEPADPRPPRKRFTLTDSGHLVFENWLTSPVAHPRELRQTFLLKLYFANLAGDEPTHQLLMAQQALCDQWLSSAPTLDGPFAQIVQSYRLYQIKAACLWLAECLSQNSIKKD
jgi:DNA-binding PadR family transcriptional regulator